MQRKVIYNSKIDDFSRSMPISSSFQELLLWKLPYEKIVAIFDLRGQRGYMEISTLEDYNWYLSSIRHDGRTPEKFFWVVNQNLLEMNRNRS